MNENRSILDLEDSHIYHDPDTGERLDITLAQESEDLCGRIVQAFRPANSLLDLQGFWDESKATNTNPQSQCV